MVRSFHAVISARHAEIPEKSLKRWDFYQNGLKRWDLAEIGPNAEIRWDVIKPANNLLALFFLHYNLQALIVDLMLNVKCLS